MVLADKIKESISARTRRNSSVLESFHLYITRSQFCTTALIVSTHLITLSVQDHRENRHICLLCNAIYRFELGTWLAYQVEVLPNVLHNNIPHICLCSFQHCCRSEYALLSRQSAWIYAKTSSSWARCYSTLEEERRGGVWRQSPFH